MWIGGAYAEYLALVGLDSEKEYDGDEALNACTVGGALGVVGGGFSAATVPTSGGKAIPSPADSTFRTMMIDSTTGTAGAGMSSANEAFDEQ